MQAISRRRLLASASVVPFLAGALALAGCAGQSANQVAATVAQDAQIIAAGLTGALSQLGTMNIPGLTPDVVAKAGTAIASINSVAAALQSATTTAAAQPLVQQLETDLNAVVGALAALGPVLPPQIALPLQAAAVLLPVIEVAVNLAATQIATPAPAGTPATSALAPMSAAQARAVLLGAAKGAR